MLKSKERHFPFKPMSEIHLLCPGGRCGFTSLYRERSCLRRFAIVIVSVHNCENMLHVSAIRGLGLAGPSDRWCLLSWADCWFSADKERLAAIASALQRRSACTCVQGRSAETTHNVGCRH